MLTADQLETANRLFAEGKTPEEVAREMGLAHTTFRLRLAQSGYRIEVTRALVPIVPVEVSVK